MKYSVSVLVVLVSLNTASCDYCKTVQGEESLGGRFSLINEDQDKSYILYCTSDECCNVGFPAVPSKVDAFQFNNKWIVARSIQDAEVGFWIIDKEFKVDLNRCDEIDCNATVKANVFGPFSQSEFLFKKDSLKIDLNLES